MKRLRLLSSSRIASVDGRNVLIGFLPFGLALLICALVPFGLSLLLRPPALPQSHSTLDRYGPWTPEDLTKIAATYDQIQEYRTTDGAVHDSIGRSLSATDLPTLVRSLCYKPLRDGRGLMSPDTTLHELVATRTSEMYTVLTDRGPLRDKEMACLVLNVGWIESQSMLPALTQAMAAGSAQAALKLREVGPDAEGAIPALEAMLLDPDCTADAAGVLFAIGDKSIPALTQGIDDKNPIVRARSVSPLVSLIAMEDNKLQGESAPLLAKVLGDSTLDIGQPYSYGGSSPRFLAQQILGRLASNNVQALAALSAAIEDPDRGISRESAEIIGYLGASARPAIPSLLKGLSDERGDIRVASADALSRLGPLANPCLPAIRKMIDGRSWDRDFTAAYTLSHFGAAGKAAMPVLIKGLHTGDMRMHDVAIEAIYRMGEVARPFLPQVAKLLQDKDPTVQSAAVSVLSHFERSGGRG